MDPNQGVVVVDTEHRILSGLAEKITLHFAAAHRHAHQTVTAIVQLGTCLVTAKKHVKHGEWEQWLNVNTPLSVRTAQNYMRLAVSFPHLPMEEAQRVSYLPLRQAMKAIVAVAPGAPEPVKVTDYYVSSREPRDAWVKTIKDVGRGVDAFAFAVQRGTITSRDIAKMRAKFKLGLADLGEIEAELDANHKTSDQLLPSEISTAA